MNFVVLSHAGLAVEHNGVRLVCDPWLIGSCYWRSWWNFPEPDLDLVRRQRPHFIYLTHLHWDHFHGPSLRTLFEPSTTILVPKVPTRRMLDDLHWLGFHNVIEVPHGQRIRLGDDFCLHSYQFGLGVDSAVVISGGGYTLFNCNDCKLFGLPLAQLMREYPRIDFLFRSHSSASPIPLCVANHENFLPRDDGSYDAADQFARCAVFSGARYAIPFASNHCFLHPETRHFNSTATTPDIARRRYDTVAAQAGVDTECVVMPPGSRWSDTGGFTIVSFDFQQRESYVEAMLQRHAASLASQLDLEARTIADFAAFESYFAMFLHSVPWFIRRWKLTVLYFRVRDCAAVHAWRVEPRRSAVSRLDAVPPEATFIDVHAIVLNDCARKRMFSVWTASKRLKIHLPGANALAHVNLWLTLLDLFETDSLPLWKLFGFRSLSVRLRRWREPVEVALIMLRRILLRERFSVSRIYPLKSA